MLFKVSNLNSNLALTLGYLNPASNNSAQYNNMYPSTEMLIQVQKYKLQYRTQITAPVQKIINLSVQKHKLQNKHIHWLCDYIL